MTDGPQFHRENDLLAAEVALGLVQGDALTEAREMLQNDSGFARLVADWHERFVTLTHDIAPVAPGKRVKKRIMSGLFPQAPVPFLQSVWLWQGISIAALATVAFMASEQYREVPVTPVEQPSVYATQMTGGEGAFQVLAVVDPQRGDIALRRVSGETPPGRVLELWAIVGENAPVSLGVLPEGAVARVALPEALADAVGAITLAISDEPPGGAPQGAPTGSIMAAGVVSEL